MLPKLYTTDSNNDGSAHDQKPQHLEETDKKEDLELWELVSPKDSHTTSQVVQQRVTESKSVLKLQDLLEKIINSSRKKPKDPAPLPPLAAPGSEQVVTKQLLEMLSRRESVHKKQRPLPESAVGSIYGGIAHSSLYSTQDPMELEDDPLLDHLSNMDQDDRNWNQTIVLKDKRIAAKQEEMEVTQAIVEATSTLDLWHHIENEINRDQDYPSYYPAILTKAIEYASKTDPYMALTIFEKAKQKSVVSYISGCTVQVYNAMLLLRWEVWRDVNGMLDLAEEMTVNGIEFDSQSRKIVRAAVHEVESEGTGAGGLLDSQEYVRDGVFWNADEKRSCNLLKELAGKWMISE